jgi:outer membrane protein
VNAAHPPGWRRAAGVAGGCLAALAALAALSAPAGAQTDLFGEMDEIDQSLAQFEAVPGGVLTQACASDTLPDALTLPLAIDRALCANPAIRQSWAIARFRAAQVGLARAALLPTLTLSGQIIRASPSTTVEGFETLNTKRTQQQQNVGLALAWVMYDAGLRQGNVSLAAHTLTGAVQAQRAAVLGVVDDTGRAYYEWWAAQGSLDAAAVAESTAAQSLRFAIARQQIGNGTVLDKLQAETALAQATLDRVKAQSTLGNTRVALATLMGLDAGQLPALAPQGDMRPRFDEQALEMLAARAQQESPSIKLATAQLDASKARIQVAEATNAPLLGITANYGRNQQTSTSVGQSFTATVPSINLQFSVPIFDGGAQAYQRHSAAAQVEAARNALEAARRQVGLDLWNAHHELGTQSQKMQAARSLVASATQADSAAETRYRAGAGTLLDLLTARSALAAAHQQDVQASAGWRVARLRIVTLCVLPLRWEPDDGR